ncbi:MAG TPA: hypothetical protein VFZ91_03135 [Allosphingosinicella sp.]
MISQSFAPAVAVAAPILAVAAAVQPAPEQAAARGAIAAMTQIEIEFAERMGHRHWWGD